MQANQCLQCPHEDALHPWLSKLRPVKILIRLRERAGWSESVLGAHVRPAPLKTDIGVNTYETSVDLDQIPILDSLDWAYVIYLQNIHGPYIMSATGFDSGQTAPVCGLIWVYSVNKCP